LSLSKWHEAAQRKVFFLCGESVMQSIRTRLSLNYLLVLAFGMALAGSLAWLAVERLYLATQRENLLAQARLIATALQGSPLPTEPQQPYSQTANVAPGVHTRLLSEGGAVVVGLPAGDALAQLPAAEQYASIPSSELVRRPEIESALNGTPSTFVRSVLGNRRVLYAADGQIQGIAYSATPLPAAGLPGDVVLQLIAVVLIAILLAMLAGSFLARKITQPLEALAEGAIAISNGDLGRRVTMESDISELDRLKQSFNNMAESLRQSDEAKRAFLADVTHELRTPLTVIKGTIETLEDGALDDQEGRGPLLTSMARETERLIRLVSELLVLTRAEAGSLPLKPRRVDLAQIARDRCGVFAELATRQGVKLEVVGAEAPAWADPDRVCQILDNLLDNAIRHSGRDTEITVALHSADTRVECAVRDQGTGIPAHHLPFVFERFYRVDPARTRKDGGTGLGLAIARALAIAQGGGIGAQSVEGQGTTMTFWLPASQSDS
jgi:signal transduction histidine kinase